MFMKNLVMLFVFSLLSIAALATDPKYPVSEIPEDLKKDVNAVIREDKRVYKIINQGKASLYVYMAVTILNEKGNDHAKRIIDYDKSRKIKDINGFSYDEFGKPMKKLRNKDIYEQSAFDGFSLFTDARFKAVDLSQATFPYTVEFEYEMEYNFLYDFEDDVINDSEKTSVQHFIYQIIYPTGLQPRYKVMNIEDKHKIENVAEGLESITWEYENIKPLKLEYLGPLVQDVCPRILAAPTKFEYSGYIGDMSTWEEFGKWNLTLNKGRDVLPEETKAKIISLTKDLPTTEQKIKAVYEYLQSKTRYVGIQLGIGGLQPFEASVVDQTGYGDCKALSNYMIALLKEIGIKGYYTRIFAGENEPEVIVDFPSHQSNHIIVAVPNKNDTIWLECTSQTNPFGYQGTFTGDRKALLINENGGVLVNTTRYSADLNIQSRTGEVSIDVSGNGSAKIKTSYSGLRYETNGLEFVLDNQYDNQKKWIQKNTGIPSFDVSFYTFKNIKDRIPTAVVSLDLKLNRLATVSGKRMFLVPNLMNRSTTIPEKVEGRKSKVILRNAYTDMDTIKYHIPEELYPEYLPEPLKIKSKFGEYEASYKLEQGSLIYTRKMKMTRGEFPPESYSELIEFYKSINKADNAKIVFLNKT
jgi:hypothetical protein